MGCWKNQYLKKVSVFYPVFEFQNKNSELKVFQQTIDPDAKSGRVDSPGDIDDS